jgi:transcriptional regulator GlxA family with amidase domain
LQNEDATLLNNNPAVAVKPIPACQNHSAEIFTQVVQYIMENLHADLSVSALARTFSLKESVLLPAFELQTGITLDQFVLRRRIERALHLLKNSHATDREISMGIGWGSAPDFQRAFASYLGVSPTEYRRSLRLKQRATSVKSHKRPCQSACIPREESRARALRAVAL